MNERIELNRYYKTAGQMFLVKDRELAQSLVQDSLQVLVDNFNLSETELREVAEESLHNLMNVKTDSESA